MYFALAEQSPLPIRQQCLRNYVGVETLNPKPCDSVTDLGLGGVPLWGSRIARICHAGSTALRKVGIKSETLPRIFEAGIKLIAQAREPSSSAEVSYQDMLTC